MLENAFAANWRTGMTRRRSEPSVPLEGLLHEIDVPDATADRVTRASLSSATANRSRIAIPAAAAVALAAVVIWALPSEQPRRAAAIELTYTLSNAEGLLVLRSPDGQWLHMSGGER